MTRATVAYSRFVPAFLTSARVRTVWRWVEHFLASIGLCFVVFHFAFEITSVTSPSMSPALQGSSYESGDRVLLEKVTGWFRAPRRWEIHAFVDEDGTPVAKRIVGLPGETISIKNRHIWINGAETQFPARLAHLKYLAAGTLAAGREVNCGRGYYVLGDDSRDSYDSRFTGSIGKERFRGRAFWILWPSTHAGLVR